MPNVFSVASQDENGKMSSFSNYSENKSSILIPGEGIQTVSVDENGNSKSKIVKGTSISAALMSGIIALGLEVNPKASFDTLNNALRKATNLNSGFINVSDFLKHVK